MRIRRALSIAVIVSAIAALVSMNCGIFVLPVTGPKALAANAHWIHFTVDIMDDDGTPLPEVTINVAKFSMDANLIVGETDKSTSETHTVNGHYEFLSFGNYGVELTFSKPGYGNVQAIYADSDMITHPPRFFSRGEFTERAVNVDKYPQQHVILTHLPATAPPRPAMLPAP